MGPLSKSICKLFVALCSVALFVHLASAGTVTYTSSSAFAAATGINVVENYGTLTDGEDIASGSTVDGITYSGFSLSDGATDLDISDLYHSISGLNLGADHTADGSAYTYFLGGEGATITFAQPVNAFGMFFDMDLNSADSYGFTTSTGATASVGGGSYDTGAKTFTFAGLTSTTPFTSITFYSVGGDADYAIPEIEAQFASTNTANSVPQPAPEPASAQLLVAGLGLVGIGLAKKKIIGRG